MALSLNVNLRMVTIFSQHKVQRIMLIGDRPSCRSVDPVVIDWWDSNRVPKQADHFCAQADDNFAASASGNVAYIAPIAEACHQSIVELALDPVDWLAESASR